STRWSRSCVAPTSCGANSGCRRRISWPPIPPALFFDLPPARVPRGFVMHARGRPMWPDGLPTLLRDHVGIAAGGAGGRIGRGRGGPRGGRGHLHFGREVFVRFDAPVGLVELVAWIVAGRGRLSALRG